jgi:hypothetical protein
VRAAFDQRVNGPASRGFRAKRLVARAAFPLASAGGERILYRAKRLAAATPYFDNFNMVLRLGMRSRWKQR